MWARPVRYAFAAVFVFVGAGECGRGRKWDNTAYTVRVPNLHTSFYFHVLRIYSCDLHRRSRICIETSLLWFSSVTRANANKKNRKKKQEKTFESRARRPSDGH